MTVRAALSSAGPHRSGAGVPRYQVRAVMTPSTAINIADRVALSALIEPIKAEFHDHISDR